jgi:transcriptional regulator with XRE-family HTH domain
VREARELLSWTQDELAAASGVSRNTVRNIERGQQASVRTLLRLAAALGIEVAKLIVSVVVLALWGWAFGSALAGAQ